MSPSTRLGAMALIDSCVDAATWRSWDVPFDPADADIDDEYRASLSRAAARAGTDESVVTGRARIQRMPVALIVGEFRFLGGSIGRVAADRIVAAVRRASHERLPLIAATSSGGTRMQEGTPAFAKMIDISRAIVAHKALGLPYLVYLRDPTMGGVFASWASLGHVCVAEPQARIGFLGPTVYEALYGRPFPVGVQTAEHLFRRGIIDAIVPTSGLADTAARSLRLLQACGTGHTPPIDDDRRGHESAADAGDALGEAGNAASTADAAAEVAATADAANVDTASAANPVSAPVDAWTAITWTRDAGRPGIQELLRDEADDVLPLNGTQAGETSGALLAAVSSLRGRRCVIIAQDRRKQVDDRRPLGAAALRTARRAMRVADQLGLPVVCIVDTPGAELSAQAEEQAVAPEIARCLADMVSLRVPTVSVILGQGCGGGALALLPARRVIVAENGWLAPLPPEGASAILFHDTAHAADMARRQRITAHDLVAEGIAHAVIPERPAAHLAPHTFSAAVAAAIVEQIRVQRG